MIRHFTLNIKIIGLILLLSTFSKSAVAAGNADVVISSSATANGSWAYSAPNYTFTPSANSAVIINTDIQNRLLGSGGFTAGNVIILTACSGSGSQSGNVTTTTTITAAAPSERTLTITAAGSITISNAINLKGATGIAGSNIVLTGTSGVAVNALLTASGSAPTGGSNATGGSGGAITLSSSGGAVSVTAGLTATGGTGGTGGIASGGAGGAITISGTSVSIGTAGTINTQGGVGPGRNGGNGGSVSVTSTSTTITISGAITTSGGNAGSSNTLGVAGGNGGAVTMNARTNLSITAAITTTGGLGNKFFQCGGSGTNVNLTGNSISFSTITTNMGAGGAGGGCSNSDGSIIQVNTPLPVELISFSAHLQKNYIYVGWQTASEINNEKFILEKSSDGENWFTIAEVNGAGNSHSILNYSYIDDGEILAVQYYRLTQVDFDGTKETSKIIEVSATISRSFQVQAYPNPTSNLCTFNFELENDGIYYLKAINNIGQEVYSTVIAGVSGNNKITLSLQNFANGIYHFQLFDNKESVVSVNVVKD